jgi:acetylornithine deacetylase/succinyl-diaminopimelate desuccinylase-like protein
MARLLASLYDDQGNGAIEGLVSEDSEGLDIPPEMARTLVGALPGVAEIGSGSIPARLWTKPSVSILAIDAPPVSEAINQLVPTAGAKVSLRIAPGEDSAEALAKLKNHLLANVPWGAEITFLHEERGEASTLETDNFAVKAWETAFTESFGVEPVYMGAGGSIPFIATFADLFPGAPILVTGCGDPTSAYHAPNESQDIGDLEKSVLAEAIAFSLLAG